MAYSIDYPKECRMVLNPDPITDVYLGDAEGKLGCTIFFFDTEYSLSELNDESNTNMKNAGANLVSNTKLTINNQLCYKATYEFTVSGIAVKQISYIFKKDNIMFNIKFGNNKKYVDASNNLIEKIIATFNME